MHHTIDRISGKPEDYVICQVCGSWNWYENENCVNCDVHLDGKCRKATEEDAKKLERTFDKYDVNESIELDV